MNLSQISIGVTGFIITSLCGIIWYVLQQFISNDKDWKRSTEKRLYIISSELTNIKEKVLTIVPTLEAKQEKQDYKSFMQLENIKTQVDNLTTKIDKELSYIKEFKSSHIDFGRIKFIENKLDDVMKLINR